MPDQIAQNPHLACCIYECSLHYGTLFTVLEAVLPPNIVQSYGLGREQCMVDASDSLRFQCGVTGGPAPTLILCTNPTSSEGRLEQHALPCLERFWTCLLHSDLARIIASKLDAKHWITATQLQTSCGAVKSAGA